MEFAATLPGGTWADNPVDVQPALAALARCVNDSTSDDGRMALLPWAAWLVGTAGEHREDDLDGVLAARAGATALRHADPATAARLAAAMAALAWPEAVQAGRLRAWRHAAGRRHTARRLIRSAVATLAGIAQVHDSADAAPVGPGGKQGVQGARHGDPATGGSELEHARRPDAPVGLVQPPRRRSRRRTSDLVQGQRQVR